MLTFVDNISKLLDFRQVATDAIQAIMFQTCTETHSNSCFNKPPAACHFFKVMLHSFTYTTVLFPSGKSSGRNKKHSKHEISQLCKMINKSPAACHFFKVMLHSFTYTAVLFPSGKSSGRNKKHSKHEISQLCKMISIMIAILKISL